MQRLGLVPRLLGFMEPEGSHCSSHLALLVKLLIECGDLDMAELQSLGLGPKVTSPPFPLIHSELCLFRVSFRHFLC
jgi:hypothetical protein